MPFDREESDDRAAFSRRAVLIGAGQTALFGLIAARLYQLQVIDGQQYALIADENRINVRLIAPMRGEIRDRFGRVVATNEPELKVLLVPEQVEDLKVTLDRVGRIVTLGPDVRREVLERAKKQRPFLPVTSRM